MRMREERVFWFSHADWLRGIAGVVNSRLGALAKRVDAELEWKEPDELQLPSRELLLDVGDEAAAELLVTALGFKSATVLEVREPAKKGWESWRRVTVLVGEKTEAEEAEEGEE